MAVFDHIPMGQAGLDDIHRWLDDYVAANRRIATKEIVGRSEEDRDIPAIVLTHPGIPDADKQVAVVTLARHGQELGARVVGPEILAYLAGDDARDILDAQRVIVLPVVNPDGFVRNEFHSSRTRLTPTERHVIGGLCRKYPPDMMIDYHSLGRTGGSKTDRGDLEAIIPANTTRWGMDEPVHRFVARRMRDAAETAGWPYEIHTLEDLAAYYFGGTDVGSQPWAFQREKVYLLHMQDDSDHYDIPEGAAYTNYTCAPAYLKWHTLVFGMETNHWAITRAGDIAASGLAPCRALLKLGCTRLPWEKDPGYPANILTGDFRISIRAVGETAAERRTSRTRIWGQRRHFNIPLREMPDRETTVARVRYVGTDLPMTFALCLRMRQCPITYVTVRGKDVAFETFDDRCARFLYIPLTLETAGTVEVFIRHGSS